MDAQFHPSVLEIGPKFDLWLTPFNAHQLLLKLEPPPPIIIGH